MNIPGKKRCLRFFFGGMKAYREMLDEWARNSYAGFEPFIEASDAEKARL